MSGESNKEAFVMCACTIHWLHTFLCNKPKPQKAYCNKYMGIPAKSLLFLCLLWYLYTGRLYYYNNATLTLAVQTPLPPSWVLVCLSFVPQQDATAVLNTSRVS